MRTHTPYPVPPSAGVSRQTAVSGESVSCENGDGFSSSPSLHESPEPSPDTTLASLPPPPPLCVHGCVCVSLCVCVCVCVCECVCECVCV